MTSLPFLPRPFLLRLYFLQFALLFIIKLPGTISGSGERKKSEKNLNTVFPWIYSLKPVFRGLGMTPAGRVLLWGNQNSLKLVLREREKSMQFQWCVMESQAGSSAQLPEGRGTGTTRKALSFLRSSWVSAPDFLCAASAGQGTPGLPAHLESTCPDSGNISGK